MDYNLFFGFHKVKGNFLGSLVVHAGALQLEGLNMTVQFVVTLFKAQGTFLDHSFKIFLLFTN